MKEKMMGKITAHDRVSQSMLLLKDNILGPESLIGGLAILMKRSMQLITIFLRMRVGGNQRGVLLMEGAALIFHLHI